ncbi:MULTISPECIES: GntR family transcriptional regulator [Clostridia]|uniref:GntR family transcriptional regulator n=1 Tax=Clostridia TaxID=186801 RepID=UPI000EA0F141|nr:MULTISPECIES: GntR family transcriptional regulator [Clostridia]NBJ70831.1 GntR family transcriptional regulator [Roseburia sp. 1XD42-34]RKI75694.1 GntR family transcriptional regulator [Clostridium sp. 1xD42-85]
MKLTMKKGPLYLQVQDILKERIINGIYPKGELIPSELELKDEFEVSLITVRRAVEQLSNQGYVEKKSGIGTIVLDNHAVSKLSKGQRFSEYLISEGNNLKKEFASLMKIETINGSILEKNFGKQCYCLERLYTLDGQPYIHFNHYIPLSVILPDEPEQLLNSLYEILFQQGIKFHRFKDEFAVEVPETTIANKLQIELRPLLQRIRYSYDINDQLFEYSVAFYNTAVHKYVVNFDV